MLKRLFPSLACLIAVRTVCGALVLYDFESDEELGRLPDCPWISVTNAFASSGAHSLRFRHPAWRTGLAEWPSFNLPVSHHDWRGFDRMVVDLVNDGESGDSLSAFLKGPAGSLEDHITVRLPAYGYRQWVTDLKRFAALPALGNVDTLHLFLTRPRSVSVHIDRIVLLKPGEPLPQPPAKMIVAEVLPLAERNLRRLSAERKALENELKVTKGHAAAHAAFVDACRRSGQSGRDFFVGFASSAVKVLPRGSRIDAKPMEPVRIRLARNEKESAQVLVTPSGRPLRNVRVSVGRLADAKGRTFPADGVACAVVGSVLTRSAPPYKVNTPEGVMDAEAGWWPDPILDYTNRADVSGTDVQSFWVRVSAPRDQPAGTYSGKITVSADEASAVSFPFSVRVNDFEIPRVSPLPLAVTFSPGIARVGGHPTAEEEKAADFPKTCCKGREAEWADFLADYYLMPDSLYSGAPRWELLERMRGQGRLGRFNLGYWTWFKDGAEERWKKETLARLRRSYDEAKRRGLLEYAYVYGCDEATRDKFPQIRRAVELIKEALPGVPVSTTAFDDGLGVGTPLSVVDWFTPLSYKYEEKQVAAARREGRQVWWYVCCQPHAPHANFYLECAAIEPRILMGAQTAMFRPDGFLYYQISQWGALHTISAGPFTDWEPRSWGEFRGDGSWTCVGLGGRPLATIRLENFRDGLEDYAYVLELERRSGKRVKVPAEVAGSLTEFSLDPGPLMLWRDRMADAIERLPPVKGCCK